MIRIKKYLSIVRQKPAVIPRVAKAMLKTWLLGRQALRGAEFAVTYRCQATCEKCSTRTLIQDNREELSVQQIVMISQKLVKAGAVLIDLTGGEPFLRKDLVEIVGELNRLPVILSVATNGLLVDEQRIKALSKAGLHVLQFGLSSPDAEEHDAIIGVPGGHGRILNAIGLARKAGMNVLLNTVVTRELLYSGKLARLVDWAQAHSCFLSMILPANVGGWNNKNVCLNQDDYKEIKKWLKHPFVTTDTETCYRKGGCPAGKEKVYISPYGDLFPCPFIQQRAGDLLKGDFQEIWRSMHSAKYDHCVNIR